MNIELRKVERPADYNGLSVSNSQIRKTESEKPAFAGIKLRSVSRPADYDGRPRSPTSPRKFSSDMSQVYSLKKPSLPDKELSDAAQKTESNITSDLTIDAPNDYEVVEIMEHEDLM